MSIHNRPRDGRQCNYAADNHPMLDATPSPQTITLTERQLATAQSQVRFWEDMADHQAKGVDLFSDQLAAAQSSEEAHVNALIQTSKELAEAEFCLKQIVESLPMKRDWLDPTIERHARALLTPASPKGAETPDAQGEG